MAADGENLNTLTVEELLTRWQGGNDAASFRIAELVYRVKSVADDLLAKTATGKRALALLREVGLNVEYEAATGAKCQISRKNATWRAKAKGNEYYLTEAWYLYMRDYLLASATVHVINKEESDLRKSMDCTRFAQRLKQMAERLVEPPVQNAKYNDEFSIAPILLTRFA